MQSEISHVVIAAAGTGGHLFPAQQLAVEIRSSKPELGLLFSGGELSKNPFFKKESFAFQDVSTATPYLRKGKTRLNIFCLMMKGIYESFCLLKACKAKVVIGFGSYHTFPLLLAALFLGIPYLIVELDAHPGKVNRLFSRWARGTAIRFPESRNALKGKNIELVSLVSSRSAKLPKDQALSYFGLTLDLPTLLIFGGSQGASFINALMCQVAPLLVDKGLRFQLIHFTGLGQQTEVDSIYKQLAIPSCVKPFEERMEFAWSAADMAFCRAGAGAVSEMLAFEVPAILIPYPQASDHHQRANACFIEKRVKGGICIEQSEMSVKRAADLIYAALTIEDKRRQWQQSIKLFKKTGEEQTLASFIMRFLC